ncbi:MULTISPECIES: hypothetical protein [unclassified Coleofasciculus]|nr:MULTISPECIES: hypothetical protein [unclassified Coleofasciculus]
MSQFHRLKAAIAKRCCVTGTYCICGAVVEVGKERSLDAVPLFFQ